MNVLESFEMEKSKELLKSLVGKYMPNAGAYETGLAGVKMYRRDEVTTPGACFYRPMIVKVVQGYKRVIMGGEAFTYGEDNILITDVDIPGLSMVCETSKQCPCMSICIELDKNLLAQLALEMPMLPRDSGPMLKGVHIQKLESDMLDAYVRLSRLFHTPEKLPVLGPMILREMHYLLLSGPDGHRLRSFYMQGSQSNQIMQAISWLKDHVSLSIPIEELADKVHMAPSTFHRHFKEITTLSPLQFQKQLRLHEAQRLMLTGLDASSAGLAVGYDSLSQFSREYKRLFGDPPRKDILRLKEKGSMPIPAKQKKTFAVQAF